jgi:exodeoxyribonuclease VII large subunit
VAAPRRDVEAEGRALARLDPLAQLATSRERVGLLLDRAVRAAGAGIAARRSGLDRAATVLPRLVSERLRRERASLDATGAALAVLDPQATLDRGYAIVRRAVDGAIVRVPAEAPGGTSLRVRVSGGELGATVESDK